MTHADRGLPQENRPLELTARGFSVTRRSRTLINLEASLPHSHGEERLRIQERIARVDHEPGGSEA